MRKPFALIIIAIIAILTACSPSTGANLPENTPPTNGTFAEYKAKLESASGTTMSDDEAAVTMITPILRCIAIEHPDMVDASRKPGTYQFVGKDAGDGSMTLAFYGEMSLSDDQLTISFNGRLQLDTFVFDVKGTIGKTSTLSVNGKSYDVSQFAGM